MTNSKPPQTFAEWRKGLRFGLGVEDETVAQVVKVAELAFTAGVASQQEEMDAVYRSLEKRVAQLADQEAEIERANAEANATYKAWHDDIVRYEAVVEAARAFKNGGLDMSNVTWELKRDQLRAALAALEKKP